MLGWLFLSKRTELLMFGCILIWPVPFVTVWVWIDDLWNKYINPQCNNHNYNHNNHSYYYLKWPTIVVINQKITFTIFCFFISMQRNNNYVRKNTQWN